MRECGWVKDKTKTARAETTGGRLTSVNHSLMNDLQALQIRVQRVAHNIRLPGNNPEDLLLCLLESDLGTLNLHAKERERDVRDEM